LDDRGRGGHKAAKAVKDDLIEIHGNARQAGHFGVTTDGVGIEAQFRFTQDKPDDNDRNNGDDKRSPKTGAKNFEGIGETGHILAHPDHIGKASEGHQSAQGDNQGGHACFYHQETVDEAA